MSEEILHRAATELFKRGYERGFVSLRDSKGMIITPDTEFYKQTANDAVIVGRELNVDKEKAIHLTVYERLGRINCIVHLKSELFEKVFRNHGRIYAYSDAEACAVGHMLKGCQDNILQITESIRENSAALTDAGLYIGADNPDEAIGRAAIIERAALICLTVGSVKPRLPRLRAKRARKHYFNGDIIEGENFFMNYGYYTKSDNGVRLYCAPDTGGEILLSDKSAKGRVAGLFSELTAESDKSYVINNSAYSIAAGVLRNAPLSVKSDKVSVEALKTKLNEEGYCLIYGMGALAEGDNLEEAMSKSLIAEEKLSAELLQDAGDQK